MREMIKALGLGIESLEHLSPVSFAFANVLGCSFSGASSILTQRTKPSDAAEVTNDDKLLPQIQVKVHMFRLSLWPFKN